MNLFESLSEIDKVTKSVDSCGDVYFVPAFSGLYAPYWNQEARGYSLTDRPSNRISLNSSIVGLSVALTRTQKMDTFYELHLKQFAIKFETFSMQWLRIVEFRWFDCR